MRLPFTGILASCIIYVYSLEKVRDLLVYFGVPLLSDDQILGLRIKIWGERVTKTKINSKKVKRELFEKFHLNEFKDFFMDKKYDQDFEDAVNLHRFRDYRIPVQAYLITGDKQYLEKFIPFEVNDRTIDIFKKYFFNTTSMSATDWIKYLGILKSQYPDDAELISLLKRGDHLTFKLRMGRIAKIDMEEMIDLANSIAFMMFRRSIENPLSAKEAKEWGNLFARMMSVRSRVKDIATTKIPELNLDEYELKPKEYNIPVLTDEKKH